MKFLGRILFCLFGAVLIIGTSPQDSYAVDYTARPSGSSKKESPKETSDKSSNTAKPQKDKNPPNMKDCSRSDLMEIKAFNRYAADKKEEFEELIGDRDSVKTPDDAEEFTKELEKLQAFYNSDKFAAKEDVYDRCGQVMPMPQEELPFWMPEEPGLDSKVDAI
ncbi:MAG: hypothetical protein ACRBDI_07405 [Alphaproteobacteria bacterium]